MFLTKSKYKSSYKTIQCYLEIRIFNVLRVIYVRKNKYLFFISVFKNDYSNETGLK